MLKIEIHRLCYYYFSKNHKIIKNGSKNVDRSKKIKEKIFEGDLKKKKGENRIKILSKYNLRGEDKDY